MKAIRLKTEHLFDTIGVGFTAPRLIVEQAETNTHRGDVV